MKPILPPRQLSDVWPDEDEGGVHPAHTSPNSPVGASTRGIDSGGGTTITPALYQPALRNRIRRPTGGTSD